VSQFPKKILLVRCDRIGDLLLTVPAISYLREKWSGVSLSMLVNKSTASLIKGHPGLEEVFTLDKQMENRGVIGTLKLVLLLKRNQFDAAFVLHPMVRVHLIVFLAGISRRVGYPVKWGKFLLTDIIEDRRHTSRRHEAENILDFIDRTPWGSQRKEPYPHRFWIAHDSAAEKKIEQLLRGMENVVALHPGASCPTKRWSAERFVELGKQLRGCGFDIAIAAGGNDSQLGNEIAREIPGAVDFSGKTTLPELASLLKKSKLLVSNDSGPVHVAVAVGTPVLSIFGRSQPGLGPERWRPLGPHDRYLCAESLTAISVDEVLKEALEILKAQ
jgi:lipopolysaccharide heptosyltransferase II